MNPNDRKIPVQLVYVKKKNFGTASSPGPSISFESQIIRKVHQDMKIDDQDEIGSKDLIEDLKHCDSSFTNFQNGNVLILDSITMDFDKSHISTEKLPESYQNKYLDLIEDQIKSNENLTKAELYEKIEILLIERTNETDENNKKINPKQVIENRFILAQFYFDARRYRKAFNIFDAIKNSYFPAMYQLGIILYDDLLDKDETLDEDEKKNKPLLDEIDSEMAFRHPNKEKWKLGFEYMLEIANLPISEKNKRLVHRAQFNVGKAYFLGFGAKQSDKKTEEFWLKSCDDGSEFGCVNAMTYLAFFYSRKNDPEFFDLNKSYFWHNEACGNGSLESQGALGAMYYYGLGCRKDFEAAYECLTNSSERGNVFSMGLLCDYYYRNKFYVKAVDLAKKVANLNDIDKISDETNCLRNFISKGIGLACFTLGRCYDLGKGVKTDPETAKFYYKKSYLFDPDICQLYQNQTTYQLI
ncbi:unnamed protein product [Brachionus calyciflorus]|uniref:LRP2-binding protein n=1 Tax=Brachionus calyciflorus TaxID=104777 RepID=A0A813QJC3_9BILA|nr:unnamed protein product [Brachionus calyciflorus]